MILGEPGSGKTTVLLYLARTLLDRAERDEKRRIPVVFNLSSWAKQRLPLNQWMLEEMVLRYQMSRKVAQNLLKTSQVFPLLDGLDEVEEAARTACVQAILRLKEQSTEYLPCVICCRTEEYQALTARLPLQYAVMLLPLSIRRQNDRLFHLISGAQKTATKYPYPYAIIRLPPRYRIRRDEVIVGSLPGGPD